MVYDHSEYLWLADVARSGEGGNLRGHLTITFMSFEERLKY